MPAVPVRRKPFYVTTPIFYVNADPHIGHLYSVVMADTIRRYQQLHDRSTLLATGTDEHGLKIQQAAQQLQLDPQTLCDRVSARFKDLTTTAGVLGDDVVFTRTTDDLHVCTVKKLWRRLMESGHIYKGVHEGWYSVSDEAFYLPAQVKQTQDPATGETITVAIESGQRVEWITEENYKFRLSAFREPLRRWLQDNPQLILPETRYNEVMAYLSQELPDLSVSRPRTRLTWGIPVPDDDDHVIYVWLDALANYLTATRTYGSLHGDMDAVPSAWPADVHIVGKDIIKFHAVYWPAFLMAANLPLPRRILAHAHWTMGRQKMSKSRGNVADPFALLDKYGSDATRYFLMRDGGLADDSDYSEELVRKRYKKELLGQLGNLLARTISPTLLPQGYIPSPPHATQLQTDDREIRSGLLELPHMVAAHFDQYEFGKGIACIEQTITQANKYFTDQTPWTLTASDNPSDHQRLATILFHTLETLRMAGIQLQPVMPNKMNTLLNILGVPSDQRRWSDVTLTEEEAGRRSVLPADKPLFPKL
ncbi:tRNA synthetases class I (M)-domain-containing protein [Syncephalis pseudoplumigaleata]|uniref:Probable methionine--tRNA ligase, mitochondrial n=1 Tax=Syncephalis pseudoplumigaleata TaxID=1712513 RepID=A0A4P9YWJ0_9FUNG|nr:tRNA synthetases class I (M)-domain-containing protein [Syncephalis pseudoplumigaleata]|eukprot:RKP23310.1 tRNA synthetases class I (M)-domain-containing protein [Syncephalis pseudoplumigaleata]